MIKNHLGKACIVLALAAAAYVPTSAVAAAEQGTRSIAGSWRGDFGAGPWVFTFGQADGKWLGNYTYPKYNGVNPVTNLTASNNAARFSINAKTSVAFHLQLDASGNAMSGTVRFGKGVAPGSAPVVVPVNLARVR